MTQQPSHTSASGCLSETHTVLSMKQNPTIVDAELDKLSFLCALKDSYGAFVYWNAAIQRTFDLPQDGLANKTEYHFMPDADAAAIRHNDKQVIRTGKELCAVESVHLPDGSPTAWFVKKFRVRQGRRYLLAVIGARIPEGDLLENGVAQANAELEPHINLCRDRLMKIAEALSHEARQAPRR